MPKLFWPIPFFLQCIKNKQQDFFMDVLRLGWVCLFSTKSKDLFIRLKFRGEVALKSVHSRFKQYPGNIWFCVERLTNNCIKKIMKNFRNHLFWGFFIHDLTFWILVDQYCWCEVDLIHRWTETVPTLSGHQARPFSSEFFIFLF